MRIKICGITQPAQGRAIAELGATALGFICVPASPRFVTGDRIAEICRTLPSPEARSERSSKPACDRIGVFANADLDDILQVARTAPLTGVQLHGDEPPSFCDRLHRALPNLELIKAFRIRRTDDLDRPSAYQDSVASVLLDAYHPQQLGGTGHTLDWNALRQFRPPRPWFLAGGLTPDNVAKALTQLHPDGIDLSSGVERSPGDKDLDRVAQLFNALARQPG